MKHLRYDLFNAAFHSTWNSPKEELAALGIRYRYFVGRSMGDDILLIDCHNIPELLPPHIAEYEIDNLQEHLGHGFSQDMIDSLNSPAKENEE
jgi:hypothetical protein